MSSIVLWYYSYIQKNYLQVEIAKTAEPNHIPPQITYLIYLLTAAFYIHCGICFLFREKSLSLRNAQDRLKIIKYFKNN